MDAKVRTRLASLKGSRTPLADYLARPEPVFGWRVAGVIDGPGYAGAVLRLTSQTWLTPEAVDRPVWEHWLTVIIPDVVEHDTAFLYITGGEHADAAPREAPAGFGRLAVETRSIVAQLNDVPNQPLVFPEHPDEPLVEDALIARQQVKFAHSRDPEELVRLPMVKSAAAAMTAVQAFMASEGGGRHAIHRFVVAGGSKRGWTTWLIGRARSSRARHHPDRDQRARSRRGHPSPLAGDGLLLASDQRLRRAWHHARHDRPSRHQGHPPHRGPARPIARCRR